MAAFGRNSFPDYFFLEEKVDDDFLGGLRSGVNTTPTFFINGEKYEDSWEDNNLLLYIWASGLLK